MGLGNPGKKYEKNRHNSGFRIIDRLAKDTDFRRTSKALAAKTKIAGKEVLLAKPLTYVNRSGEAALSLLTRYRLKKESLLVVCDDFSLPFGTIRLRIQGSSGGHNGLQSIIETIGSGFARLRIGIGNPTTSADWSNYVLSNFSPEEEKNLPEILDNAVEEIVSYLKGRN
ncbi:MAG: aminoacyl-tRNA hydrolase [Candidatus Omnitrophota bacterium]